MTNRETLLAVRAIVADAPPGANECGCLEDALCRTLYGKAWCYKFAKTLGIEEIEPTRREVDLHQHPVYIVLLALANSLVNTVNQRYLFTYNDAVSKTERLALIDRVIDSL